MTNGTINTIHADVLIVGSGLSGLLLALKLSEAGAFVVVASKAFLSDSNTAYAQGGLAAVLSGVDADSTDLHLKDTIAAGAGLTNYSAARMIIEEGQTLIGQLTEIGVKFDANSAGKLELAREGGHSCSRVIHTKDTTGRSISQALISQVLASRNICAMENATATEMSFAGGRCVGARILLKNKPMHVVAGQVVLATGGLGQLFERTTNPEIATGDGIALAFRAGARLVDMEFVQFHPTALSKPNAPTFLLSEALRGAGALLLDQNGNYFAKRFHPDGELATRDVVALGIATVMRENNISSIYLDLRPIGSEKLNKQFPNILSTCRDFGIDPLEQPVPVAPAAHYFMGGVWTDENGATTIPGLYAIGECASTGLHGANRLASNSLLEAGVMALRTARSIADNGVMAPAISTRRLKTTTPYMVPSNLPRLKALMYQYAGLQRDEIGLLYLLGELSAMEIRALPSTRTVLEASNMLLLGQLIAKSALTRRESRGAHMRLDYPQSDNKFCQRFWISKDSTGWLEVDGSPLAVNAPPAFASRP